MRKLKAETVIIGNGAAAMLAAAKFVAQDKPVALINPAMSFDFGDLRPSANYTGLSLWSAAYRNEKEVSLAHLYDELESRFTEIFPASLEASGFSRGEHWALLSSTPVHRTATDELEKEFFKLERKNWSAGQYRLVNRENVETRLNHLGFQALNVSQLSGAIVRTNALFWDSAQIGFHLMNFIQGKFFSHGEQSGLHCLVDAEIVQRNGRQIVVSHQNEEVSVEYGKALIFLTGDLLPAIRKIAASCEEPWIQGVRRRRREQHFVWFNRKKRNDPTPIWITLGEAGYCSSKDNKVLATWVSPRGPDGLERIIDEGIRMLDKGAAFCRSSRVFRLEWDWKTPQWKTTQHQTYWATSFEGDLWSIMEILWNLPQ